MKLRNNYKVNEDTDPMNFDPIFGSLGSTPEKSPTDNGANDTSNTSPDGDNYAIDKRDGKLGLDYLLPGIQDILSNNPSTQPVHGTDRRGNQIKGTLPDLNDYSINASPKLKNNFAHDTNALNRALSSLKYKNANASKTNILVFLLLGKYVELNYDTVELGGNVNETAYLNSHGQVLLTFTDTQNVSYKNGPDGRRALVSKTFRDYINAVKTTISRNQLGK